jgi:hypothetical protein
MNLIHTHIIHPLHNNDDQCDPHTRSIEYVHLHRQNDRAPRPASLIKRARCTGVRDT